MQRLIPSLLLAVVSSSAVAENLYLSCVYESRPYMRGRSIQLVVDEQRKQVTLGDGTVGENVSINAVRIALTAKGNLIEVDRLSGRFMTKEGTADHNGACTVNPKPKF